MNFSEGEKPSKGAQSGGSGELADGRTDEKDNVGTTSQSSVTGLSRGYYGLPVLKAPVWRWEVWAYFFLGGLAGGSFVVASLARLFGDDDDRPIWQTGYLISGLAVLGCPPLLIKDLGRPTRFLNMLRIFKPRSPMSLGVWGLVGFSGCALSQALISLRAIQEPNDSARRSLAAGRVSQIVAVMGTVLGLFLGSYTGVLLSVTSVPLWSRSRLLGATFLASALSSGSAAVTLGLQLRGQATARRTAALDHFKLVALLVESTGLAIFLRESGRVARPLYSLGMMGRSFLIGAVSLGIGVPLLSQLPVARSSRLKPALSAIATLVGGLLLRRSIVEAGHWSTRDGETTFWHTDPVERWTK